MGITISGPALQYRHEAGVRTTTGAGRQTARGSQASRAGPRRSRARGLGRFAGHPRRRVPCGRRPNPAEESGAVQAPRLMRYLSLGEIVDLRLTTQLSSGGRAVRPGLREKKPLSRPPSAAAHGSAQPLSSTSRLQTGGFNNPTTHAPASGRQPDSHDAMLQAPEPFPNQQADRAALGEQGEKPHRQPGREAVRP